MTSITTPAASATRPLHVVTGLTGLFNIPKTPEEAAKWACDADDETAILKYREKIAGDYQGTVDKLRPGPAFPLIRALADMRHTLGDSVNLRIVSRHAGDHAVTGPYRELFDRYGLTSKDIEVFISNHYTDDEPKHVDGKSRALTRLKRLHAVQPIDLYLCTSRSLSLLALEHGIPTVYLEPMTTEDTSFFARWSPENLAGKKVPLNVESDIDSTFFDSISDWFWHLCNVGMRKNPDDPNEIPDAAVLLFIQYELSRMDEPMGPGTAFPFVDGLKRLRVLEAEKLGLQSPWQSAVTYSGLTMRANKTLERAMRSMKHYGFTGPLAFTGMDGLTQRLSKDKVLIDEQPLIMFEDAPKHIKAARSAGIPVGIPLRGPYQTVSLRVAGEREILKRAKELVFKLADEKGFTINKEAIERHVAKLLAPYENSAPSRGE